MRLTRYKVTDFRSVRDSGWIETDGVTAMIGVNESGKTNLLVPLWKLNPVREGEVQPTSDYPKKMFGTIRENPDQYAFVTAEFQTGEGASAIAAKAGISAADASAVRVTRYYDGAYRVEFFQHSQKSSEPEQAVRNELDGLLRNIEAVEVEDAEAKLLESINATITDLVSKIPAAGVLDVQQLVAVRDGLKSLIPAPPVEESKLVPVINAFMDKFTEIINILATPDPGKRDGVVDAVVSMLPKFVYYSNYGNLDSEIYLPQVVENLERKDLGAKEAAKARTLRVLFRFVRLQPKEILELGRDFKDPSNQNREPNQDEIAKIAEAKRTRSIFLQSAGSKLTQDFKDWWKQGDYRFRFEADGNHFRIWVADDRRTEEVELESRSTGLQWFLSFYLVFLVESLGEHNNAVLLLDEPGMSLHPLAQRNLSAFFEGLSSTNQIIYTSHSPFLIDADRLDRARKVFIATDGTTKATPDLRHSDDPKQAGAAYAVYSALNLSVVESLLVGCQPVIVEGPSDQHYLTAIKALLIAGKKIAPERELVFPPSGGTKTARVVASILSGRDEELPIILLDDDGPGRKMAAELKSSLYTAEKNKVLSVAEYAGFEGAEVEDLFPVDFLAEVLDRVERRPETLFASYVKAGEPFVRQVENWAMAQQIDLEKHWKVELAKRAKQTAISRGIARFDGTAVGRWEKLFRAFAVKAEM